ncbi:MAG: coproporphyrinogen III oxidase family protein, partial [Candidatus Omnitrophica bacterium]|nr:coproporphyrinogen III oxidase family protein [Candidatus Omnitrophota bacterium]
ESVSDSILDCLSEWKVSRLSLGVQTFDDPRLISLGRNHSAETAVRGYERLRRRGFENINLDLMCAFPQQTFPELESDLQKLVALNPEHASIYTLSVEKNSRFFTKNVQLPNDHAIADQYEMIRAYLDRHGLRQYEVSNFSIPGFESLHNSNYWRMEPYIGLGMGAHSFYQNRRYHNPPKLMEYLKLDHKTFPCISKCATIPPEVLLVDHICFGLRLNEGLDLQELQHKTGCRLEGSKRQMLESWCEEGWLSNEGARYRLTDRGRLILDELCAKII